MVDAPGNPVSFSLTGGQAPDPVGAGHLLPDMNTETLIADRAHGADKRVIEQLAEAGKGIVIPPGANRRVAGNHDRELCKART